MEREICECKRDYKSPLSGICELCWDEKYPDEEETIEESKKSFGEREFVDYTESLELKELGFDEPCLGYYIKNSSLWCNWLDVKFNDDPSNDKEDFVADAPLYQQAFKWFRENYKLFGQVNICTYFIYDMSNNDGFHTTLEMVKQYDKLCDNYEEAELACLKKLIEIVKK